MMLPHQQCQVCCLLPCGAAETGEIYHLTFKPPPPEIVDRLVRPSGTNRWHWTIMATAPVFVHSIKRWCAHHLLPGVQVQRSDDTEEKAVNRLRTYHANVDAVIGYYKGQLVEVSACSPAAELARG